MSRSSPFRGTWTRKRENENARIEHVKARKRENGENAQSRKAVFAESKKNTTVNPTSNQKRTEMGKTRKDENAKTAKSVLVFLVSYFLALSGFLVSVAASSWQVAFYALKAPSTHSKSPNFNPSLNMKSQSSLVPLCDARGCGRPGASTGPHCPGGLAILQELWPTTKGWSGHNPTFLKT